MPSSATATMCLKSRIPTLLPRRPGDDTARLFTLSPDRPGDNSHVPDSRLPSHPSAPIALALMTSKSTFVLGHRHLLGIEGLSAADITGLLDLSEEYVELNR